MFRSSSPAAGERLVPLGARARLAEVSLRICLVTPFAWSQPHDVNDHVAGVARELRRLGHTVTVLAPSTRARDLREGRRALQSGELGDFVAIGPALPVSRRSTLAAPVGVRASLALALAHGRFDIVHGFEPGVPSLSYLALRDTEALAVATFFSPERIFYPPGKAQRTRLLGRIDALLATSQVTADAAAERFAGDYTVISPGVDRERFRPSTKTKRIVVELVPGEREVARAAMRRLDALDGWELVLLRHSALAKRPYVPLRLRGRVHVRTQPSVDDRAALLNGASEVVTAPAGSERLALEAAASSGAGVPGDGFDAVAAELDRVYRGLAGRRRTEADRRRSARRPRVDRLRPPHPHVVVARLQRPGRGLARCSGGDRARRDRSHRPQRLRRRARGRRARAGP